MARPSFPAPCPPGRSLGARRVGRSFRLRLTFRYLTTDDCIFCQIVEGTAPAGVVYSDGTVMAFMDIAPIVPGHLLVIPKRHARLVGDLEGTEGTTCWMIATTLAKALRGSGLRVEGVNLFVADGEA